jgi:hypothetical protein
MASLPVEVLAATFYCAIHRQSMIESTKLLAALTFVTYDGCLLLLTRCHPIHPIPALPCFRLSLIIIISSLSPVTLPERGCDYSLLQVALPLFLFQYSHMLSGCYIAG